MLEKLSKQQEREMYEHRDEYIRFITQNKGQPTNDFATLRKDIDWIYARANLQPPKYILTARSYYEEKMMINHILQHGLSADPVYPLTELVNRLTNEYINKTAGKGTRDLKDRTYREVHNQVFAEIRDQVYAQIDKGLGFRDIKMSDIDAGQMVKADVETQHWEPIYEQIEQMVKDMITAQVHSQTDDQTNKTIDKEFVAPKFWHDLWNQAKRNASKELYAQAWSEMTRNFNPPFNRPVVDQTNAQLSERQMPADDIAFNIWKQVVEQSNFRLPGDAAGDIAEQVGNDIKPVVGDLANMPEVQMNRKVGNSVYEDISQKVHMHVMGEVYGRITSEITDQVSKQIAVYLEGKMTDAMHNQVRSVPPGLYNLVRQAVGRTVLAQIGQNIRIPIENQYREEKMQWVEQGFGLPWNSWLAFYGFFEKMGVVDNPDYHRYYNSFLRGNRIWSVQFFRTWCIVTYLPLRIYRDNRNRLHNTEGSAVEWEKGTDNTNFFIHGISFGTTKKDRELYEKIVTGSIKVEEVMKIGNMEQRNAALSVIPHQRLLDELQAQLISTHVQQKRGHKYMPREEYEALKQHPIKLYRIDHNKVRDIMGREDIYILFYTDPSTGREYFSFVDPNNATDAATAMASKFGLSKEDYLEGLAVES